MMAAVWMQYVFPVSDFMTFANVSKCFWTWIMPMEMLLLSHHDLIFEYSFSANTRMRTTTYSNIANTSIPMWCFRYNIWIFILCQFCYENYDIFMPITSISKMWCFRYKSVNTMPAFTTAVSCFLCQAEVSLESIYDNLDPNLGFWKLISLSGALQEWGQEQADFPS